MQVAVGPLPEMMQLVGLKVPVPPLQLHTMNAWVGAGFYSTIFGPLPFSVGERPVEGVRLWRVVR